MTEAEWLSCTTPTLIWDYLYEKRNLRKLQLAACACCRRIWHLLPEKYRFFAELSEQAADGLVTDEQLNVAWDADKDDRWISNPEATAVVVASGLMAGIRGEYDFDCAGTYALSAITGQPCRYGDSDELDLTIPAVAAEQEAQTRLLRCVTGNPFRPVTIDLSWRAWNDGTISKLAQVIYDERAFDRLPILADALEEAGCTNADILAHCRLPGEHVRGCWVLDLLLGKS